jgi:hypothetical protein
VSEHPDAPRKTASEADVMADQDLRDHQEDDADDVERVRALWPALMAQGRARAGRAPPRLSRWCFSAGRVEVKRNAPDRFASDRHERVD